MEEKFWDTELTITMTGLLVVGIVIISMGVFLNFFSSVLYWLLVMPVLFLIVLSYIIVIYLYWSYKREKKR